MTTIAIAPIHTKADYHAALRRVEELFDAKPKTAAGDELEILSVLVEAYEREHHPLPHSSGADVLRHLMETNDLTQSDLTEVGTQAVVSLILAGKRQLNVRQIKALAERFHVSPAAFL
ncbi:MAG: transcriptional regulator [Planctomycetota bacterium]